MKVNLNIIGCVYFYTQMPHIYLEAHESQNKVIVMDINVIYKSIGDY